ncbi:hypothetical protein [Dyadobacter tibetensis]|uniref:hypothetical protein n=1 Tax=Dyadobacter tibetensis TaxID=1211851 RepID=UPI00046F9607|nr:hypothetical protein [Dyadobacter tibetensis]
MIKNKYLIILLAVVIMLAGYFLFRWYRISSEAWKHIPSSAIVVVTSSHLQDSTYTLSEAELDVKRLPLIDVASDNLSSLNLLTSDSKKLYELLNDKNITYSFHPRSATEWGVLVYIPIDQESVGWLKKPDNPAIQMRHHTFQDHRIMDIYDSSSHPLFSFILLDDYLIISYFGDLVEDVIRTSSLSLQGRNLKSRFADTEHSNNGVSIYLTEDAWKSVIPSLGPQHHYTHFLKNFPYFQDLHIRNSKDPHHIAIESDGSERPNYYLSQLFKDVKGSTFTGHKYISQQTAQLYRYASAEKEKFHKKYLDWHESNETEGWSKLYYHIGNDRKLLTDNFGSELIFCQLEQSSSLADAKILLAEYAHYDKLRAPLLKLAQLSNEETNSSHDKFQGYDIFAIGVNEFPATLFGPSFNGFNKTFVTYVAPYLVMSNNAQVLQNYLVDYENQITWKQSPEYDSVLISSKNEAQIALVANLRKIQSGSGSSASKTYSDLTAKIETIVLSCKVDGRKAYPSINLIPKKRATPAKVLNKTFLNIDVEWPIFSDQSLAALQNQVDGSSELLLTDKAFNLLKIDNLKTGQTETITQLDGHLQTEAFKVDFLNIGRQQRILATSTSVYAIDQDDDSLYTTFKQSLPAGNSIKSLYLVDGGLDGSNRFIVRSQNDELFIWESVTSPLKKLSRSLRFENIQGPVVTLNQIGNRGFIVSQYNGKIYLLNESGVVRRGFPADLLTRTAGPFSWVQNNLTGQPELVGTSTSGQLLRINLEGKIVSRKQLLRPQPGANFRIIFDRNSLDWLLIRSTGSRTAILDKEGRELFEIKDILPNSDIQYHFFGVDNRFISIKSGNYTTLFDMRGKRLGDKAIPSELPVRLTYQPGFYKLLIFSRSENKIQVWSIKLR